MARLRRAELFEPSEIAVVHVMSRVVRRCFLLGTDSVTGKNYDHRKRWIEQQLEQAAAHFGIDLLAFSIMSNHFHLVLRSRPDVVKTWDDTEVARRWLMLCPRRRLKDGTARSPTEPELNSIRNDPEHVQEIRRRLSDISWWMRLICQRIAVRANAEDGEQGKFWQNRFKAVRLLDEAAILACAAYVDLNPIRAAMAKTVEQSEFTSAQRRVQSLQEANSGRQSIGESDSVGEYGQAASADAFLSPVCVDESGADECAEAVAPQANRSGRRCSDRGFTSLTKAGYLQLLDWTARQITADREGFTSLDPPPIFDRLRIRPEVWCHLTTNFGRYFCLVAGQPHRVDDYCSRQRGERFRMRTEARQLLSA